MRTLFVYLCLFLAVINFDFQHENIYFYSYVDTCNFIGGAIRCYEFDIEFYVLLQKRPSESSRNLLGDDDDEDDDDESDNTELTHFGRSLSEVENFKDPVVSDSDEDSDSGRISGRF